MISKSFALARTFNDIGVPVILTDVRLKLCSLVP